MDLDDTEFDFCHSISRRCLFIVGFARSNTTIVQNIINTEKAAFIMGEANWHLPKPENDFREWYNRQHVSFGNIPTKSTYVPKLMSHEGIKWYRYASRLAETYQYVGDKMAFSSAHFSLLSEDSTQAFFEQRFFDSKFVFLLRHPLDTLASFRISFSVESEEKMIPNYVAWIRFVRMWCSWIRTFPNCITLFDEEMASDGGKALKEFTTLDLDAFPRLYRSNGKPKYSLQDLGERFLPYAESFELVYQLAKESILEPSYWQVEQKRSSVNDWPEAKLLTPQGRIWTESNRLLEVLQSEYAEFLPRQC